MMGTIELTDGMRELARRHFVMLEAQNIKRNISTLPLRVSGYADVMHLVADLVKVAILALDSNGGAAQAHIPEPETNIGGMLAVILDLLPYEEAELLDRIRQEVLSPSVDDDEFLLAQVMVTPGWFIAQSGN